MPAEQIDYIVIGSGFGGFVAAMRLTEKGYRVVPGHKLSGDYVQNHKRYR